MTPTRWQRVQDLVNAAMELPAAERQHFIREVCGSNDELQTQIESLLESYEQAGSFIEQIVEVSAYHAFGAASLSAGDRICSYQITGIIGHGGMGSVYSARRMDDQFRQNVAIKVLRDGLGITPELLTRFRAERQILANLTHPNIARLLDGGITPSGLPYLVMEYIEGTTIDRFSESRALSIRERLILFQQVCAAVQYAHQNLIVHRDIKPANVMVTEDGVSKLLDFGIAKLLSPDALGQTTVVLTRPAERLMTPEYASPEQIRGEPVTTATDVYALGVLLYELLTGQRPFRGENLGPAALERLICETSPTRPSSVRVLTERISVDLDNIVLKAMHKDPARRYASAAELSDDLRRFLQGFPVAARGDSWRYRARKFVSRHRMATTTAILFAVTITALSIGLAIQASRAKQEARTSDQVANFLVSLIENFRPDQAQGRSSGPRDILDRGAERIESELSAEPLVTARLFNILGTTYRELGVLDRAGSMLKKAYEIRARTLGPESEQAADSLLTMAEIASETGEFDRAGRDYEKVLRIYKQALGVRNEKTLMVMNDIADLRRVLGDFAGAKQKYIELIALANEVKGPKDWQTLNAKKEFVVVLARQGEYAPAESLAREVLATEIEVMGPNNPTVSLSLNHLAFILAETARFAEAETVFRQALDLQRKVDGVEHPAIALTLSTLGWVMRERGRYSEAQRIGEEAFAMASKLNGPRSLSTIACQGELGLTMLAQGDLKRARELLEPSLAIRLALGNPNNPELGDNYDRMGLVELEAKNLQKAHSDIQHGLEIRERFYGRNNENVAKSLNHLARVQAVEGNFKAAEQNYREATTIAAAKFTDGHIITAEGLLGLGTALMTQGRAAEARDPLVRSLEIRKKLLPRDHRDVAASEAALARCVNLRNASTIKP